MARSLFSFVKARDAPLISLVASVHKLKMYINPFMAITIIWRFGLITSCGNDSAIILNFRRAFYWLVHMNQSFMFFYYRFHAPRTIDYRLWQQTMYCQLGQKWSILHHGLLWSTTQSQKSCETQWRDAQKQDIIKIYMCMSFVR